MFAYRGPDGELRSGPRVAAVCGAWNYLRPDTTLGDRSGEVTAKVWIQDAFRFSQGALSLWLNCGDKAWWVWPVLASEGQPPGEMSFTVEGPPEIRPLTTGGVAP